MRSGISISLSPSDRDRLDRIIKDRNAAQKHAWRAEIVLLTSDGVGTNEIMPGGRDPRRSYMAKHKALRLLDPLGARCD